MRVPFSLLQQRYLRVIFLAYVIDLSLVSSSSKFLSVETLLELQRLLLNILSCGPVDLITSVGYII